MSSLDIRIPDGRTAFHPGESINVETTWDLTSDPDAIELRLVWNTVGKGTSDMGVAWTERIDHPMAHDGRQLSVSLPIAPYSFSGKLVSLVWALELVALPSEESTRLEIVIAPGGNEVQLLKPGEVAEVES